MLSPVDVAPVVAQELGPLVVAAIAGSGPEPLVLGVDEWWRRESELLPSGAVHVEAAERHLEDASHRFDRILAVNRLRPALSLHAGWLQNALSSEGLIWFVEVVRVRRALWQGESAVPDWSPTLALWDAGISPITMDRPRIVGDDGSWEIVTGTARITPEVALEM